MIAAGVVGMAAGLCESIARYSLAAWPDGRGAAVQAATLRARANETAAANARAYTAARDALQTPAESGTTGRDATLRAALLSAADTLLAIASSAGDCAGLAAEIARGCAPGLRADAAGAAELATAAARAAAALVDINLALLPGDERRARVRAIVAAAEAECVRAREAT